MNEGRAWLGRPADWLVAILIAGLLVGGGYWLLSQRAEEARDPTWERIVETSVLPVCTDPSWPPFEFIDEATDQIQGFDIDLAQHLAERLVAGGRAEIVTVGFDSLYDALLAGRCDLVLSALPYEPMRTQDVVYSVAYFNAGLVVLAQEGADHIERLEDLEGRAVAVEWGFVPEGDADQRDFLRSLGPRRYETAADAIRAMHAGEVDAAIVDRITALAYMRECEGLRFVGEPIYDVNYVTPVRPDAFRLLEEVNHILLEMREDGTLEDLQETWF
jgi:polar amino acid transport system substrate-binding protein